LKNFAVGFRRMELYLRFWCFHQHRKIRSISMGTILLIVLILLLVGALPTWPYSTGWGYYPSSGLGLVLVILIVLVVLGRI
jgi:hypothetical protein